MKQFFTKIISLVKRVPWTILLAKWIWRVNRCKEDTDPGLVMVMFAFGAILCMISVMGHSMSAEHLTLVGTCFVGVKMFILGAMAGFVLVYGFWEINQGYKRIHRWEGDYLRKHDE